MRVGGVDQDVVEGDPRLLGDPPRRVVQDVAPEHHDVAGDQAGTTAVGPLDHHGRGPQLTLLALDLHRPHMPADDHIIGRLQQPRRGPRLQLAGLDRRPARPRTRTIEESRVLPPYSPSTSQPLRYGGCTNWFASSAPVTRRLAASHSSVVCGNRVARQPRSTDSVRGPE